MTKELEKYLENDPVFSEKVKSTIREDPSLSAKFTPYLKDEKVWMIPRLSYTCTDEETEDEVPIWCISAQIVGGT